MIGHFPVKDIPEVACHGRCRPKATFSQLYNVTFFERFVNLKRRENGEVSMEVILREARSLGRVECVLVTLWRSFASLKMMIHLRCIWDAGL
jgi:hypothetical protein